MRKQFSTSLQDDLIKKVKVYAAENDLTVNTVIENALKLWFDSLNPTTICSENIKKNPE